MAAWALFRLPHADHYVRIEQTVGEPEELPSCAELNGRSGFVVAPFDVRQEQPIMLIRPDKLERITKELKGPKSQVRQIEPTSPDADYAIDFANFHAQLEQGTFQKIVLARCADEATSAPIPPEALFHRACQCYPRMFISLVYTTKTGYWLTATPEILLEGDGSAWRTIALAGTMKLEGSQLQGEGESVTWTTKNIQEQRYVATYITECLEQFTADFKEEGPRTVRAANLVHLRSDFTFTLPDSSRLGDLLQALHPTPAVCGLPKHESFQFIVHNEHTPRRYYSGFMGPLCLEEGRSTHLYVSLRCMNVEGNQYHLYAGGGLLKDSVMQQEWQETEAKLETMRSLLIEEYV
ncbi:MAG: isochorismate synthase [Prevotella sp.]|nr:isochorismate synthase [Prevotella sp.]